MTTQQTSHQALQMLVLAGPESGQDELVAALSDLGSVHLVTDVEEALRALRERPFDIVVSEYAAFLPLANAAGRQQAEAILENIGHGVCVVSREGRLVSANSKLRSYPQPAIDAVREQCGKLCRELANEGAQQGQQYSRRSHVDAPGEFKFDISASPIFDADGRVTQVVAVVTDTTASRRLQDKINAIDAAGAALVRLNTEATAEMEVVERLGLLEDKIIKYTRDLMHFDHFCVRVLDKKTNRLETVLAGGMSEEAKSLAIYAASEGNGISGYVAATGRSYIAPDIRKDPRYLPGLDGARSSLTVPLRLHDQVIGILDVESAEVAAFTEDDRQFAEIFGRYVAIALHILQLLAVERSTTTGQIASDVAMELAAPLNDIVTDATNIMEEFIGHDDLRHRLHAIIDNVDLVKRTLHDMSAATGVAGITPEKAVKDPVIDGKRILIADDEDIIRETIGDLLTKCGANTVTARDGVEAIKLVESRQFDLVLSDIRMPGASGYEVFAAVKKVNVHCPVILITGFGYDPNHTIVRASVEGLAAVLFKPFKVEQLLEDVRHALTANAV